MNKIEFLDLLRQSLTGEIDNSILEQSIRFYNEYISSQAGKSEEEVIEEIGDPRLIAKTIIESENASRGITGNRNDDYSSKNNYNDYYDNSNHHKSSDYNKVYHIKWYHMAIIIVVLFFLFTFLIRLGWLLLRMFFVFFMPILIFILLFWVVFRKR